MPACAAAKYIALSGTFCLFQTQARAQATPDAPAQKVTLTVEAGVPLRLILVDKLPIKRQGEPVVARLVEPVFSVDREVAPPGAEALGRIVKLRKAPRRVRVMAILNGDFTPLREPEIEFDTLVLKDGRRIALRTRTLPGSDTTVRIGGGKGKKRGLAGQAIDAARAQIEARKRAVIVAVRTPGKLKRLETAALNRLPYHPQSLPAGTRFNAELVAPLDFGAASIPAAQLVELSSQPAPDSVVEARLITSLDSGTAKKGDSVEAALSQPLVSASGRLLYPVGSRLQGTVTQARPARRWHRNGQLRFMFQDLQLPPGFEPPSGNARPPRPRLVEARLESVDVDHKDAVKIDEEGGTKVAASKKRFIAPVVVAMLAGRGLDHDRIRSHGVPTGAYSSNAGGRAVSGAVGFGLIGSALGQISRPFAASLGFYGLGWSVYSNLIARGQEVIFPAHTRIEIRFGARGGEPAKSPPNDRLIRPLGYDNLILGPRSPAL